MQVIGEVRDKRGELLFSMFTSTVSARRGHYYAHHHAAHELTLVRSGTGKYRAAREYEIDAGDAFFFKNSEPHCVCDVESGEMTFLNLHITPYYFWYIGERGGAFGTAFLQKRFAGNRLLELLGEAGLSHVSALMAKMEGELTERAEGYALIAESYLNDILVTLCRCALPTVEKPEYGGRASRIYESLRQIDEQFCQPLELSELARRVNLEKTYYSALFKRVIGISPWEYILIKRIERATELLRMTDKSVLEIALCCGFNNTANFNKHFKKHTATTPRAFRHMEKGVACPEEESLINRNPAVAVIADG